MKKLSIIIPAYQAERYLSRCLESILRNSSEIEILIVDDGSTDRTSKICEKYSSNHSNIRFWRKNNEGPGAARKYAIQHLDSEYVAFADADDYLEPNAYDIVLSNFDSSTDIIEFGYNIVDENGKVISTKLPVKSELFGKECGLYYAKHDGANNFLWNKVFRSTLFADVDFLPLYAGEDALVLAQLFLFAKKYKSINEPLYNYVQTYDSLVRKPFSLSRMDNLRACNFINDFYTRNAPELCVYSKQTICSTIVVLYCEFNNNDSIGNKRMLLDNLLNEYRKTRNSTRFSELIQNGSTRRKIMLILFELSPALCTKIYTWRKGKGK